MSDGNRRNITAGKMSVNQHENISPLGSGIPPRTSASNTVTSKRVPLKLSIPSVRYQFPDARQPSTAPVHSMSKPFNGTKFTHTPEFVAGSPLSNGSRFGTLSQRIGEFEEIDDGFMMGSPMISAFDSNGSFNSLTASPEHSPLIAQLMEATGSSPGTASSQGTGSSSSISRLMRLSPAQLHHGCYQPKQQHNEVKERDLNNQLLENRPPANKRGYRRR